MPFSWVQQKAKYGKTLAIPSTEMQGKQGAMILLARARFPDSSQCISKTTAFIRLCFQLRRTDDLDEAIDRYGKPTRIETTSEGKLYVWDFAADPAIPGVKTKEDGAYAKNSYGYHLKILFDNERAAAILMSSDVP